MKIISFFSFKGGVGRTALLTNLGAYWAGRGKIVVLMDLDLMAPGLAYSPLAGPHLYPEGAGRGTSDMVAALQPLAEILDRDAEAEEEIEEAAKEAFLPPHWLLREMRLDQQGKKQGKEPDRGQLLLIDAGSHPLAGAPPETDGILAPIPPRRGTSDETPRQNLYRNLAYQLRKDLEQWRVPDTYPTAGRAIDYLLIDSRTGFAELLDLGLGYLADRIVLVAGLNPQNLKGLDLTLNALLGNKERIPIDELHRQLSVVFSPVPAAEDETVFQALEQALKILNHARRMAANLEYERLPETFVLHYTPILATSEYPLATRRPESLYGREVLRIARHLEGETQDRDQDATLRRIRDQLLHITAPTKQAPETPPVSPPSDRRPNPLTDLPAWYWPLGRVEESVRIEKLDELLSANPAITTDHREYFLNRLANSLVLFSEGGRRGVLNIYPSLSQQQVDEFLTVLEEAQKHFESQIEQSPHHVFDQFHRHIPEWAGIVLGDETAGWHRYLSAPLEEKGPFAHAESWPHYWLGLAHGLIARQGDKEAAERAIEQAESRAEQSERETLAEQLLEFELPETAPPETRHWLEERARRLAPGHSWLDFLTARRLLQAPEPDADRAEQLLAPLLDQPPADSDRCYNLAALILERLPPLAARTEPLLRRAIELDPQNAAPWYGLGVLLTQHLDRYEEAEAAYRKAIELDPKLAHPWHNLGNLLMQHLDRYQEAEAAYRKSIELDPKFAFPWYGLGNLLSDHLDRYEEAEAAYRKSIELDPKLALPWYGLGNLLTQHLDRHEEAEAAYRKAIELDPKFAIPWNGLGNLLADHLDRYQEAEAAYRRAIELDLKFAYPWNGLGNLLKNHLDRYEEAEAAYRRAIELDPKYAYPWNGLGLLYRNLHRDCEEASRCLTEGLTRAEPDSLIAAYLRMNRGRLELLRGRPGRAREALRQALDGFDRQSGLQANTLWLAVALAGPTAPEDDPTSEVGAKENPTEASPPTLVERHTRRAREALERDPESAVARYLFIASLAAGEADEGLWQGIQARLETHQDRFEFIDDLYLFAGLRPDAAPAAARRVAALLALPAERIARFRDRPKPPDWLERYRPFAAGRSQGAGDPADRPHFCR